MKTENKSKTDAARTNGQETRPNKPKQPDTQSAPDNGDPEAQYEDKDES